MNQVLNEIRDSKPFCEVTNSLVNFTLPGRPNVFFPSLYPLLLHDDKACEVYLLLPLNGHTFFHEGELRVTLHWAGNRAVLFELFDGHLHLWCTNNKKTRSKDDVPHKQESWVITRLFFLCMKKKNILCLWCRWISWGILVTLLFELQIICF